MSKQNFILILLTLILSLYNTAMFGFFKNMFANAEQNQAGLKTAVKNAAFLVDVRTPSEFAGGSVSGAVNIPLDTLPNQLSQFKDKPAIVVFCRSGNRSGQAKAILEQNGFKSIINGGTWENVSQIVNEVRP